MSNNKDVLSMLQSRIARRAKIIDEIDQLSFGIVFYVDDQKADKKAMKEIVQRRREVKVLCKALTNYSKNTRTELAYGV